MGRGWSKLPKNKTNVKTKIVERLLAMRNMVDGEYTLDQTRVIGILTNVWGSIRPAAILHHNDRVRVFGIVMTIDENRYMYERLARGVGSKDDIDDPKYYPQQINQSIAFHYNNQNIVVKMPDDMNDVTGAEEIDANDRMRISITRDCKYFS